jgi:uncharacterized membrane protein YebE (DUF533 family)
MSASGLLEQLLRAGRDLASQGQGVAEKGLGIPGEGPERDAMLSGLGKGALITGVLGALLGTKTGREVGGTALKLGGLAALGGVAYKAYRDWQSSQTGATPPPPPGAPVNELGGEAANQRGIALMRAMIAAAKADGRIDEDERAKLREGIAQFGLDPQTVQMLEAEIDRGLDPAEVAKGADSPEAAAEIYLASRLMVDLDHWQERAYLSELASALGLAPDLVEQLELQATQAAAG